MGRLRLCWFWPLAGMFGCSLLWIYWKTEAVESGEIVFLPITFDEKPIDESERRINTSFTEEIPINQPTGSDWELFQLRRAIPLPSLASSLQSWPSEQGEIHPDLYQPPLLEKPNLEASSNVSCVIRKFGFTKAQADEVYNPNKRLRRCADLPSSFISLQEK